MVRDEATIKATATGSVVGWSNSGMKKTEVVELELTASLGCQAESIEPLAQRLLDPSQHVERLPLEPLAYEADLEGPERRYWSRCWSCRRSRC